MPDVNTEQVGDGYGAARHPRGSLMAMAEEGSLTSFERLRRFTRNCID
jgi:hypothetical protein